VRTNTVCYIYSHGTTLLRSGTCTDSDLRWRPSPGDRQQFQNLKVWVGMPIRWKNLQRKRQNKNKGKYHDTPEKKMQWYLHQNADLKWFHVSTAASSIQDSTILRSTLLPVTRPTLLVSEETTRRLMEYLETEGNFRVKRCKTKGMGLLERRHRWKKIKMRQVFRYNQRNRFKGIQWKLPSCKSDKM